MGHLADDGHYPRFLLGLLSAQIPVAEKDAMCDMRGPEQPGAADHRVGKIYPVLSLVEYGGAVYGDGARLLDTGIQLSAGASPAGSAVVVSAGISAGIADPLRGGCVVL